MAHVWTIIKKELRAYFNSPAGYIFLSVFWVLSSWMYIRTLFFLGEASMRNYFSLLPWIFLFFVPAVSMRMWSEEKKIGTMEVLMTWPVRDGAIVAGKFLASLLFICIALGGSLILPIILGSIGNPDWGVIGAGYLGTFLFAAAFLSVGLFASSLTRNQVVALIMGAAFVFLLLIIGNDSVLMFMPIWLSSVLKGLSLGTHYQSVIRGVIDSRDLIYYFSVIGFFLYLNSKVIESRKWQ